MCCSVSRFNVIDYRHTVIDYRRNLKKKKVHKILTGYKSNDNNNVEYVTKNSGKNRKKTLKLIKVLI